MLRRLPLLFLLLLIACEPSDPAPPAPDCLSNPELPGCEDAAAPACDDDADEVADGALYDKHGAQGANTLHSWGIAQIGGHQYDLCDPGTQWQYHCWWRGHGYNRLHVYSNVPPNGTQPRTRTLRRVSWSYCWSFQADTTWDTLPAGTAWVCVPGTCVDVTNRHTPSGGSCRSGTLFDELPMTVQPWSYSTVEMWVTPQAGWIGNPQGGVWMDLSAVYTDGP